MKTVPFSPRADVSQIERVRELLEGRACVVVGSAPLRTTTADVKDTDVVIAVNGGISSVPSAVDLWLVASRVVDRPGNPQIKPMHRLMLQQAKERTVGHVLLLRGPKDASEGDTLAALKHVKCRYHNWSVLDKPTKRWLEGELCARAKDNQPCSSGLLAAAVACWCGAQSVRLVGFSFLPGYHYIAKTYAPSWWRNHVTADRRALRALQQRFGGVLSGAILEQVAV